MKECPICGLKYEGFRTGYTYADIFAMFWSYDEDQETWHPKRRRTILGRWHEIKLKLWAEHIENCKQGDYDHATKIETDIDYPLNEY